AAFVVGGLLLALCLTTLFGGGTPIPFASGEKGEVRASDSPSSLSNGSGSSDPAPSSANALCPSSGPTILGIQWNCIAVLNLTEVILILAAIGIVAYVFKNSDKAELPGEAGDVPVTDEEEEMYRENRKLGLPYHPTEEEEE
ncbi:MAG: hypothetical protein WCA77_07260, partial [Thermoplasmata archaeon]